MADSSFGFAPPPTDTTAMEGTHSFTGTAPPPAAAHYLPGNPLPYLAPSATHQPELLLLSWMIATLRTLVTDLQNHPILTDPIPYPSSFTDQQAYRLYLNTGPEHLAPPGHHHRGPMPGHQHTPISARLTGLTRPLQDGPSRSVPTMCHNQLPLHTNPATDSSANSYPTSASPDHTPYSTR